MNRGYMKIVVCLLFIAGAHAAPASSLPEIIKNMGGQVDLRGMPKISFNLVERQDAPELYRLGLFFRITHTVKVSHGNEARTQWNLPALRTCVYEDRQGDWIWLTPTGRQVRFRKLDNGFAAGDDDSSIKRLPQDDCVEITDRSSRVWRYRNGCIESVTAWNGVYSFTHEEGTLLSIFLTRQHETRQLLKCVYSDTGELVELIFSGDHKCTLVWSSGHCLSALKLGNGMRMDFKYQNSLLSAWRETGKPWNELKWKRHGQKRITAFQRATVILEEDAFYRYDWSRIRGLDVLKVYKKDGGMLSETRIGSMGIRQKIITNEGELSLEHKFSRRGQ